MRQSPADQVTKKRKSVAATPKTGQSLGNSLPYPRRKDRLSMVRALIEKWSEALSQKTTKSGVAELVRLLVLEKELSASQQTVREIKVSWVEPKATESSKSE